jgi:hypothetical protein
MTEKSFLHLQAERLTEQLVAKRAELRTNPADRVLALEIEDLERRRDATQATADHHAKLAADRDAEAKRREQEARSALEQALMDDYRKASPGTTQEEARAALPDLLHRHRLAQLDAEAAAVAAVKRQFRL